MHDRYVPKKACVHHSKLPNSRVFPDTPTEHPALRYGRQLCLFLVNHTPSVSLCRFVVHTIPRSSAAWFVVLQAKLDLCLPCSAHELVHLETISPRPSGKGLELDASGMTAAVEPTSCRQDRSRRWRPPSSLNATPCVFELIETTTPALVVKRKPYVNVDAARHREALR